MSPCSTTSSLAWIRVRCIILKHSVALGRHGQIDDQTAEGQYHRVAGFHLLAAINIYWNTVQLGEAAASINFSGTTPNPVLLDRGLPLG